MGFGAFLSRRRINLSRLCDALTPIVPPRLGVPAVYSLYFVDICAVIASSQPRRVPVELPDGSVNYIFLYPYLSALYVRFRRELKHEPIWFCEGLPFHDRPCFADKITELCNMYPILLKATSAELDTQASFIAVQWLIVRSSINTHKIDFLLTCQGACTCNCNISAISHPIPVEQTSLRKDTMIITYTACNSALDSSFGADHMFTNDPSLPHSNPPIHSKSSQNSQSEFFGISELEHGHSTMKKAYAYYDPIDILDEMLSQGKQIDCCQCCGLPILLNNSNLSITGRGTTSFLTFFNFRYAPPGAHVTPGNSVENALFSCFNDNSTTYLKPLPVIQETTVPKTNLFNTILAEREVGHILRSILNQPLTLLPNTQAELAEFDISAVTSQSLTVIAVNKLQQMSLLSKKSTDLRGHCPSSSGLCFSNHIRQASTVASASNNISQHFHLNGDSFTNVSGGDDVAQSPRVFSPENIITSKSILGASENGNTTPVSSQTRKSLKPNTASANGGMTAKQTGGGGTMSHHSNGIIPQKKVLNSNPFSPYKESRRSPSVRHSIVKQKIMKDSSRTALYNDKTVMIKSSDIAVANTKANSTFSINAASITTKRSNSTESKKSLISGISSLRHSSKINTKLISTKKKSIHIVIETRSKDSSAGARSPRNVPNADARDINTNSLLAFANNASQDGSISAFSSSQQKPFKIRRKIDFSNYLINSIPSSSKQTNIDASPIHSRTPTQYSLSDEPSQESIIHANQSFNSIGGDSCSMSGIEVSDEFACSSAAKSTIMKGFAESTDRRSDAGLSGTTHAPQPDNLACPPEYIDSPATPSCPAPASSELESTTAIPLSLITALQAHHIVTTRKQAIKPKHRTLGPEILESSLATTLYKAPHQAHLLVRWHILNDELTQYNTENSYQLKRLVTVNTLYEDRTRLRLFLKFERLFLYLMTMLVRDAIKYSPSISKDDNDGQMKTQSIDIHPLETASDTSSISDNTVPDLSSGISNYMKLNLFIKAKLRNIASLFSSIKKFLNTSLFFKRKSPEQPEIIPQPKAPEEAFELPQEVSQPQQEIPEPLYTSPDYYKLYNLRRICAQISRCLYKESFKNNPTCYSVIKAKLSLILTALSTNQQDNLLRNLNNVTPTSLKHVSFSLFTDCKEDGKKTIDDHINDWLGIPCSKNKDLAIFSTTQPKKWTSIMSDVHFDINANIPILAVYFSFSTLFWSGVIKSGLLRNHLLLKTQVPPALFVDNLTCGLSESVSISSPETAIICRAHIRDNVTDVSLENSCFTTTSSHMWDDPQISDESHRDPLDHCCENIGSGCVLSQQVQSIAITDDGLLAKRQESCHELLEILHENACILQNSSTSGDQYLSTGFVFLLAPNVKDHPLYKLLLVNDNSNLTHSYQAFGASLTNEKLLLNTYFCTNRFFVPQPNKLALFSILTISGGLFMSKDERKSMETIVRETLACLRLTYYDLDFYYYT